MHVRHVSTRPGATFFLPGTKGAEIHESMKPREGETVIVKHDPNAFRETKLMEHLRERDIGRLVVMGMMTHMCVDSSTRAAADAGFACTTRVRRAICRSAARRFQRRACTTRSLLR